MRFALRHGSVVHLVHDRTTHLLHATTVGPDGERRSVLGAPFVALMLAQGEMDITADQRRVAAWLAAKGGDADA